MTDRRARSAVFLDRDGVLNEHVGLLSRAEDFRLLPQSGRAVRRLNEAGLLAVVVTNQPVVARGLCSLEELTRIHVKMEALLGREGAKVDGIYLCPHHPDRGPPCACRKPEPGMIAQAAEELRIDLKTSFIVGDTFRDVVCGKRAAVTTVGVRTGEGCRTCTGDAEPEYMFDDVGAAVDFIVDRLRRGAEEAT